MEFYTRGFISLVQSFKKRKYVSNLIDLITDFFTLFQSDSEKWGRSVNVWSCVNRQIVLQIIINTLCNHSIIETQTYIISGKHEWFESFSGGVMDLRAILWADLKILDIGYWLKSGMADVWNHQPLSTSQANHTKKKHFFIYILLIFEGSNPTSS